MLVASYLGKAESRNTHGGRPGRPGSQDHKVTSDAAAEGSVKFQAATDANTPRVVGILPASPGIMTVY